MSFGWFICFYGIGWLVTTCALFTILERKYGELKWILLDDCLSGGTDITLAASLLGGVCSLVFWPVVSPLNLITMMREIDKIAKEYDL